MARKYKTVGERMAERRLALREQLWPGLDEKDLWLRKKREVKGFTTIPRTLPIHMRIMDDLSNGRPVSSTYLDLWARSHDEGYAEVGNPREAAYAAGFSSQRAESTWRTRIRVLEQLGFIKTVAGPNSTYQYVLILNPYKVVKSLNDAGRVQKGSWIALFNRAQEIGATDLREPA